MNRLESAFPRPRGPEGDQLLEHMSRFFDWGVLVFAAASTPPPKHWAAPPIFPPARRRAPLLQNTVKKHIPFSEEQAPGKANLYAVEPTTRPPLRAKRTARPEGCRLRALPLRGGGGHDLINPSLFVHADCTRQNHLARTLSYGTGTCFCLWFSKKTAGWSARFFPVRSNMETKP